MKDNNRNEALVVGCAGVVCAAVAFFTDYPSLVATFVLLAIAFFIDAYRKRRR